MPRKNSFLPMMIGGLLLGNVFVATPALAATPPQVHVYVQIAPPRAIVESRPRSPGRGYVWIAGYQQWNGRSHVWVPGHWERAPRANARWAPGQWKHDRRGWYFVEGRWR